jgi:hypothetical protein
MRFTLPFGWVMYTVGAVGEWLTEAAVQVKKVLTYAAIAFVAFYLFTRPADAASAVKGAMDTVVNAADSLALFFTKLT